MEENLAYERKKYSYADIEKMDDDKRYEIIDGNMYVMESPAVKHQLIAGETHAQLRDFLKGKTCKPFIAPLDVILSKSKQKDKIYNVVQPDVFVVCDPEKYKSDKIYGAPDFLIEITSQNARHDKLYKFNLYQKYRVKEYWIIDPIECTISPYVLNENDVYELHKIYHITEEVPIKVLKGCKICLKELYQENKNILKETEEEYKYME